MGTAQEEKDPESQATYLGRVGRFLDFFFLGTRKRGRWRDELGISWRMLGEG